MLDIKFVRDNPDAVKENIKKKSSRRSFRMQSSLSLTKSSRRTPSTASA